jgi:hypothetical protein
LTERKKRRMALNYSRNNLRTISFVGAGAALLAVFGYLLMKSNKKKPKRRSSKSTSAMKLSTESLNSIKSQKSKKSTSSNSKHQQQIELPVFCGQEFGTIEIATLDQNEKKAKTNSQAQKVAASVNTTETCQLNEVLKSKQISTPIDDSKRASTSSSSSLSSSSICDKQLNQSELEFPSSKKPIQVAPTFAEKVSSYSNIEPINSYKTMQSLASPDRQTNDLINNNQQQQPTQQSQSESEILKVVTNNDSNEDQTLTFNEEDDLKAASHEDVTHHDDFVNVINNKNDLNLVNNSLTTATNQKQNEITSEHQLLDEKMSEMSPEVSEPIIRTEMTILQNGDFEDNQQIRLMTTNNINDNLKKMVTPTQTTPINEPATTATTTTTTLSTSTSPPQRILKPQHSEDYESSSSSSSSSSSVASGFTKSTSSSSSIKIKSNFQETSPTTNVIAVSPPQNPTQSRTPTSTPISPSTKTIKKIENQQKTIPLTNNSINKKKKKDRNSDNHQTQHHSYPSSSSSVNQHKNTSSAIKSTSSSSSSTSSSATNGIFEELVVYEFNFPRNYCGKLIGKNGANVDLIRSKTQTQIAVRNDPLSDDMQIVCVSGRIEDVDKALDMIDSRFPQNSFPDISFKPISKPIVYRRYNPEKKNEIMANESRVLVAASNMYVDLEAAAASSNKSTNISQNENEARLINVHVTAVVNAGHVFVQLPTHPTYENLQKLDECMFLLYSNDNDQKDVVDQRVPGVDKQNQDFEIEGEGDKSTIINSNIPIMSEPIDIGAICVAPTSYGWHRAMVTSYQTRDDTKKAVPDYNEDCGLATVKFLDYGGYLPIPVNQLRQLR